MNPDNITLNVCLGDVMSTWELPVDVNVTMQQLRAAICAVEPNDLLQAIVNHIDLDNFIEIVSVEIVFLFKFLIILPPTGTNKSPMHWKFIQEL